ncbi:MAG: UDP-N-acetylmuramoyl-L-alanyl-D-glutamate--2,6-diaminopimelate ligase [Gemmatimonadota bacterium]
MLIPTERIAMALASANLLVEVRGALPDWVTSVDDDSRRVHRASLFVAVKGSERDGHNYLERARAAGAAAAVVEDASRTALPALVVSDGRLAAPIVAAAAYDWPAKRLRLLGVTGTNGKSTTVHIIRHLLDEPGARAASVGTVGVLVGSGGTPLPDTSGLTTPGPVELQAGLRRLVDAGVRSVAMEVSSHALDQHRVDALTFEAVVFTNLTRDHLDYHGSMTAYRSAKARLVDQLAPEGTLVVNAEDPAWRSLRAAKRCTFGTRGRADFGARGARFNSTGTRFTLVAARATYDVVLPLVGDFNVANALGAAAAAYATGLPLDAIARRLASVPQTPGRLEVIHREPTVLRDYAHTPDALERALRAVRPFTRGRLIVVFGAGGDRDKGKRPLMGGIAERLADIVIVTSDNPRTEDPERILDDIEAGMTRGEHGRIEDRREAIARALALAKSDDVIVLAGKGHETYQVRGTEKLPFDEKRIVAELARARA